MGFRRSSVSSTSSELTSESSGTDSTGSNLTQKELQGSSRRGSTDSADSGLDSEYDLMKIKENWEPIKKDLPKCDSQCWLRKMAKMHPKPLSTERVPIRETAPVSKERMTRIASRLYQPIQSWQTRLLILQPGGIDSPIDCKLTTANLSPWSGLGIAELSTTIEYEALSYTWGPPNFTASIVINKMSYPVTVHLADCLRTLRYIDKPRYLWIDALCINQFDIDEKSRQVRAMLLIYKNAFRVIIWLGSAVDKKTRQFLYLLSKEEETKEREETIRETQHDKACKKALEEIVGLTALFLKNPWFSRTWIRQEFVVARKAYFVCDDIEIRDKWFIKHVRRLVRLQHRLGMGHLGELSWDNPLLVLANDRTRLYPVIPEMIEFDKYKRWYMAEGYRIREVSHMGEWFRVIFPAIEFQATEARDRVYGIVGMLMDSATTTSRASNLSTPNKNMVIDYTRPVTTVYHDLWKFMINQSRNLGPICIFEDRKTVNKNMPSWVPEFWRLEDRLIPDMPVWSETLFSPNSPENTMAEIQDLSDNGRLLLKVMTFGEVTKAKANSSRLEWNSKKEQKEDTSHSLAKFIKLPLEYDETGQEVESDCLDVPELISRYSYKVFEIETKVIHSLSRLVRFRRARFILLAAQSVREGDLVVFASGAVEPLVVRKKPGTKDEYYYLGPALLATDVTRVRDSENSGSPKWHLFVSASHVMEDSKPYLHTRIFLV
ncbi:heterokaryon incompatibility protein-domain-containing protein [Xylogone sp. PMI_703]|nr:heterokaryon incompatibility protein-domain-containing protein [Xylogone sp. PMI_703]